MGLPTRDWFCGYGLCSLKFFMFSPHNIIHMAELESLCCGKSAIYFLSRSLPLAPSNGCPPKLGPRRSGGGAEGCGDGCGAFPVIGGSEPPFLFGVFRNSKLCRSFAICPVASFTWVSSSPNLVPT